MQEAKTRKQLEIYNKGLKELKLQLVQPKLDCKELEQEGQLEGDNL